MQLVIDSATAACSVALIDGEAVIDERHEVVGRGHAERLIPLIHDLVSERRPSSILVDCGPGSFTGVRVGLAAAHGLSLGWKVPLFGYSSLAAIAVQGTEDNLAVALIAGHGQLFVQSYARYPLQPIDEIRSLLPEEAACVITAHHIHGSGAEMLVSARGFGEAIDALPRASDVSRLPIRLRSLSPKPIYGRPPDAKPMQ